MTHNRTDDRPTWRFSFELLGKLKVTLQGESGWWTNHGRFVRRICTQALAAIFPPKLCMQLPHGQEAALPHQLYTKRPPRMGHDYAQASRQRDNLRPSVLQSLPPECREIFLLKSDDEIEIEDIATLLNISENRVRHLLAVAQLAFARATVPRPGASPSEPNL